MFAHACPFPLRRFSPLLLVFLLATGSACAPESTPSSAGEVGPTTRPPAAFTDVTAPAGLATFRHENGDVGLRWYPEQMGSGGGFLDYDGDGWLDVLLLGGGAWHERATGDAYRSLHLYRNNGDDGGGLTFTDVTEAAGLAGLDAYTIGLAAADYDNDGDTDVFVSNLGPNMLLRNEGGTFTEVGAAAGLADVDEWSSSALFFDANRDGHLDLYVGTYVDWTPETDKFCPEGGAVKLYCVPADYDGRLSHFYLNRGDGTFTNASAEAGFVEGLAPERDKALGVAELDYNRDGWPDLVVVHDGEADQLFENDGDGTFTERGRISGLAFSEHGEARAGMGVDVGVVDHTGEPTVFVGNFSEEMVGVYRHTANGLFLDRSAASRIGRPSLLTLTFGLFLFDVDLDGHLDLFAANGHVYPDRLSDQDKITFRQAPQLYLGHGDGTFSEVVPPPDSPLADSLVARGAAYGDLDRDGDLDVLLTENDGSAHLWRNDRFSPDAPAEDPLPVLRVAVEGTDSNLDGLGTRLVAHVAGQRQERRVRTGSSYLSQSDPVAVFGLGAAAVVDTLEVWWPSGRVERHVEVAGGQEVQLREGDGIVRATPLPYRPASPLAGR